jgi:hypothetical protein
MLSAMIHDIVLNDGCGWVLSCHAKQMKEAAALACACTDHLV